MGAEAVVEANSADDRAGRDTYWEDSEAILEEFTRWRADRSAEPSDSDAVRRELIAGLLRVMMAEE